jgi:hypothetical protein
VKATQIAANAFKKPVVKPTVVKPAVVKPAPGVKDTRFQTAQQKNVNKAKLNRLAQNNARVVKTGTGKGIRSKVKTTLSKMKPENFRNVKTALKLGKLGRLKLLLVGIGPAGWVALIGVTLVQEAVFAYVQDIVDEIETERGITPGEGDAFVMPVVTPSQSVFQRHKPNWQAINAGSNQVNALTTVTKQKNAAVQPSVDGEGGDGKGTAVVNSGNTTNTSAVINNYGVDYGAGYFNSEKVFADPYIYPKPMGPGY